MSLQTVCRLCLSMNTPVRALDDGPLRDVYEKLTNISLITPHRPLVACLLCYCQLRKCHNLMVRAARANKVLSQIMHCGEVVSTDYISLIGREACKLNSPLSLATTELIAFTGSEHDLMESAIKRETVQFRRTEYKDMDMDRPICEEDIKCEELEDEKCFDRTLLHNEEEMESGVMIDERDVKSEELEGTVDVDNEGWASEQDIDAAVLGDLTMEIEKLIHEGDMKREEIDGAEKIKREEIMHKVWEAADIERSYDSEGSAPAVKCKRTHTKTQDRTPGDQDITEKRRKQRTVEETESPNTNTNTDVSENTEEAAVSLQVSKNTSTCSNTATNRGNVTVGSDNESTSTNTDVDGRRSQHLRNTYICNDCGDMFDDKQLLTQHIEHHDTDERETGEGSVLKCTTLRRQILYTNVKLFECSICLRSFTRKYSLITHLRIHTKEKPFECSTCQRLFSHKTSLITHVRTHTKEKPFQCSICQRTFSHKGHLNIHFRRHTKETPFECATCHRRFIEKAKLNRHLRIHTKEKPFECSICQRTFTEKCNLNRHLTIHTEEKPFECYICHRRFNQKGNLNSHFRIHTK